MLIRKITRKRRACVQANKRGCTELKKNLFGKPYKQKTFKARIFKDVIEIDEKHNIKLRKQKFKHQNYKMGKINLIMW